MSALPAGAEASATPALGLPQAVHSGLKSIDAICAANVQGLQHNWYWWWKALSHKYCCVVLPNMHEAMPSPQLAQASALAVCLCGRLSGSRNG